MTRRRSPKGIGFGFLFIGLALFGLAAFQSIHVVRETRIGQRLVETGEPAPALVVGVDRIERSQCSRSQRFTCTPAVNLIATVVFPASDQRSGAELHITTDEFATYQSGDELFIDLIYLPSDPTETERIQGDRLASASNEWLNIYILAAFGLTFTTIGSIALFVARKLSERPSTGPHT